MAIRRMISSKIVDQDIFLDLPATSRLLYYDLLIRADDDGFITPQRIIRMTGASADDLRVLEAKEFVHKWEDGVIVLLHWREHNHVPADRYTASDYNPRLRSIGKKYALGARESVYKVDTNSKQVGYKVYPQDRLGKDRLGKNNTITNYVSENTETEINEDETYEMRKLWKECVGTTLRNNLKENLRDFRYLKKELTDHLPEYLQAVRMLRADTFQKRTLQAKLVNYTGVRQELERLEAYMQAHVDRKAINIIPEIS